MAKTWLQLGTGKRRIPTMTQFTRHLADKLVALAWAAMAVLLTASLLTYDAADPLPDPWPPLDRIYSPDRLVDPVNAQVTNACGRLGAVAADISLTAIGVSAYLLVLLVAAQAVRSWLGQRSDTPRMQLLGCLLTLAGVSSLAALLIPGWSLGPVIGAGGYLGALLATVLRLHFAIVGATIVAASVLAAGLLLLVDETFYQPLAWLTKRIWRVVRRVAGRSDGTEAIGAEDDAAAETSAGPSIRIRGERIELREEDEEEETEDEAEQEWEEDDLDAEEEASDADDENSHKAAPSVPVKVKRRVKKRREEELDRDEVMTQLDQASLTTTDDGYVLPSLDLLEISDDFCFEEQAKEVRKKAKVLEQTFANFGFTVRVVEIETGPVIAQYEVELEAGLRLSKITGLADDLAIALRVPSVRIVAPIPGKNTVGIEVPNETRQIVRLREIMEETSRKVDKMKIPLFLGKDVCGNPLVVDLATMPHLLIAGRTGTGKSVCLNAIITSMLMTRRPDEVRMLLIDPKMVELSGYGRLPHLMHPVVTDMRKAEAILAWAVDKMEERYSLLAKVGVRNISSYNKLDRQQLIDRLQPANDLEEQAIPSRLPFIVIVADEMADLMMTAGKEVEQHIIRLAQKSRAVGIHLILATQKPTVDVITGLIKSNLPARISFQVASRTDSRVVLDEMGADKLLGNGDMLFLWPGTSMLIRGQGTYVTDDEINRVVDAASTGEQNFVDELVSLKVEDDQAGPPEKLRKRDDLYEQAVEIVVREGRGSVSLLQRCLGIGYGRAARLIDYMAEDGIVGEYAGSQAREVLMSLADWERMQSGGGETDRDPKAASTKSRILTLPADGEDTSAPWEEEEPAEEEWSDEESSDRPDEPADAAEWEEDEDEDVGEEDAWEEGDEEDAEAVEEEWDDDEWEEGEEGEWEEDGEEEWDEDQADEAGEEDAHAEDEEWDDEEWEDEEVA